MSSARRTASQTIETEVLVIGAGPAGMAAVAAASRACMMCLTPAGRTAFTACAVSARALPAARAPRACPCRTDRG